MKNRKILEQNSVNPLIKMNQNELLTRKFKDPYTDQGEIVIRFPLNCYGLGLIHKKGIKIAQMTRSVNEGLEIRITISVFNRFRISVTAIKHTNVVPA